VRALVHPARGSRTGREDLGIGNVGAVPGADREHVVAAAGAVVSRLLQPKPRASLRYVMR
jgi:hypothetical protein